MGQQSASLLGTSGSTVEGARPDPNAVGPQPGVATEGTGLMGMLGGFKKLNDIAAFMGDTPEEREKNAKAFAALTKDVSNTVKDIGESTLMQRMMQEGGGSLSYLSEGQGPSGGVAAIPKTFDPSVAGQIMSRLGFK